MLWKRVDPNVETERRIQGAIHVAMGMLGWLIPDNETAVRATSLESEDISAELPDELKDPFAALDRDREHAGDQLVDPAA